MSEQTITVHDGHRKNPTVLNRAQYDALCASGMMWEFHPDAPLKWPFPVEAVQPTPDQPTAPGYSGLSKQEVAERLKQPAATRTLADCSPQEIEKLSAQFAGIEPTATATPRTAAERHKTHACYDAVSADFARTLERELSSAQAALAEANEVIRKASQDSLEMRDDLLKQLAEAKAEVARLKHALFIEEQNRNQLAILGHENTALRAELVEKNEKHKDMGKIIVELRAEVAILKAAHWIHSLTKDELESANFYADLEGYRVRAEKAESELTALRSRVAELEQDKAKKCPQCEGHLIQPRDAMPYCENCGWPDENRPSPLVDNITDAVMAVVSPEGYDPEEREQIRAAIDAAKGQP